VSSAYATSLEFL